MYGETFIMQNFIYNTKVLLTNLIYWRKSNVCMTISMQENHEPKIQERRKVSERMKTQSRFLIIG
jgi:hypothetical protein